jgi:hypothetical protein
MLCRPHRSNKGLCPSAGSRTSYEAENWRNGHRDLGLPLCEVPEFEQREAQKQTPQGSCSLATQPLILQAQSSRWSLRIIKAEERDGNANADDTAARCRDPSHDRAAINARRPLHVSFQILCKKSFAKPMPRKMKPPARNAEAVDSRPAANRMGSNDSRTLAAHRQALFSQDACQEKARASSLAFASGGVHVGSGGSSPERRGRFGSSASWRSSSRSSR